MSYNDCDFVVVLPQSGLWEIWFQNGYCSVCGVKWRAEILCGRGQVLFGMIIDVIFKNFTRPSPYHDGKCGI